MTTQIRGRDRMLSTRANHGEPMRRNTEGIEYVVAAITFRCLGVEVARRRMAKNERGWSRDRRLVLGHRRSASKAQNSLLTSSQERQSKETQVPLFRASLRRSRRR